MYAVAIVRTAVYKCVSIWLTPLWDGWEYMFTTLLFGEHNKSVKENNMAKFNLDIKNVTLGGNVVVGDAIINLEVPDDLFTACVNNLTKLTEIMFSPPKSTCTCHVNDEDKRPPYVGKPDNSFAPMDVE